MHQRLSVQIKEKCQKKHFIMNFCQVEFSQYGKIQDLIVDRSRGHALVYFDQVAWTLTNMTSKKQIKGKLLSRSKTLLSNHELFFLERIILSTFINASYKIHSGSGLFKTRLPGENSYIADF